MRFKKVLFVIPPFPGVNQSKDVLILGVGSLSQYLSDNGVENKVFDMRFGYSADDLKKCIEEYKPDLVGMQIMTYRHDVAYDILNAIKSDKYSLIVGGHHVSTIDDQILNETPADFAIRLEGEDALLELCKGEPFKDIKNLSYRENGKVVKNPLRPFINDLDRLNFPRYEQFELSKYNSQIPIMTSRGCPFQCTFCPSAATIGRPFRVRSPKHVFDELKFWYDKGHKRFAFVDDNFTLIPKRVIELCSLIEKSDIKDLDIYCQGIRADNLTHEVLKVMKKVGFSQLGIGVEVGNDKMLKVIKKGETMAQIEQAVKWALEEGFDIQFYCMIGLPYETVEDVEDTFKLALKYPISDVHFYNVIPFPKTELLDWVVKNNYVIGDLDEALKYRENFSRVPFFETPELPFKERVRLLKKAEKIEKIILKRYFVRKMKPTFGFLSKPLAFIFFLEPVRKLVNLIFQNKVGSAVIKKFLKTFKVEVHYY